MEMPKLPGNPHLVTLGYLLGIVVLVVAGVLIYRAVQQAQEDRRR